MAMEDELSQISIKTHHLLCSLWLSIESAHLVTQNCRSSILAEAWRDEGVILNSNVLL
jgi:hypothetical protein